MILNYYYDFYFSYLLKVVINKYNYNNICMKNLKYMKKQKKEKQKTKLKL